MRRMMLLVCLFFSILFFPGCGVTPAAEEGRDAAMTHAAPSDSPSPEGSIEPWPWDDLPLQAGSGVFPDGGTAVQPTGRTLSASTCHGRNLRLSEEMRAYARAGSSLWHLCYRTPTRTTSVSSLAYMRPTWVVTSFFHEPSRTLREVLVVTAPTAANPWTMNVLIVLSPGTRPFFSLLNRYPSGAMLGAVDESMETGDPITHGTLQMWRVDAEGHQAASTPGVGVVCTVTSPTSMQREAFFIPHLACLGGFESCRLGTYDCRDMLSLPL